MVKNALFCIDTDKALEYNILLVLDYAPLFAFDRRKFDEITYFSRRSGKTFGL